MSSAAYLLIYHGSRDPRPHQGAEQLAQLLRQQIQIATSLYPLVDVAALELADLPLHQKIIEFAQKARTFEIDRIQLIPLFLLPGVHVREDIPREITLAKQEISKTMQLELKSYLGAYPDLIPLLEEQFKPYRAEARILLSHGSRYPGSYQAIASLCHQLNAIPAYWSVEPDLETQVQTLIHQGSKTIAILPYFLFSGGITEAIVQQVQQLQQTLPEIQLYLGEPLGVTEALAKVIPKEI